MTSVSSQKSILELAKQGDGEAIATLINRSIQSKGITATADLDPDRPECLNIDLRSPQRINQKAIVSLIRKGMLSLQVESIKQLAISAYQSDYETARDTQIWQVDFQLESSSDLTPPNPSPSSRSSTPTPPEIAPSPLPVKLPVQLEPVATLVHQPVQIKHIPQTYQDIIIRFTDPLYGNIKCLCTLTELIQVINSFSFGNANPALKNLLEAIAESTTIDENSDRIINNISVLQPGSQWQKAKIRLVVNIFFEAEGYVPPTHTNLQTNLVNSMINEVITLEASESLESLEAIETPALSIAEKAVEELEAKSEPKIPELKIPESNNTKDAIETLKTPKQILLEDLSSLLTDMGKPELGDKTLETSNQSDRVKSDQKVESNQTTDVLTIDELSKVW